MIKYHLELTHSAEKELHRYHPKLQDRIINKILMLNENPRPRGFKKLFGSNNYRVRLGDYRIIYSIDRDDDIVIEKTEFRNDNTY